jgi:hypothetical protein
MCPKDVYKFGNAIVTTSNRAAGIGRRASTSKAPLIKKRNHPYLHAASPCYNHSFCKRSPLSPCSLWQAGGDKRGALSSSPSFSAVGSTPLSPSPRKALSSSSAPATPLPAETKNEMEPVFRKFDSNDDDRSWRRCSRAWATRPPATRCCA